MIDYEVGSIPTRPLTIAVRDEMDYPVNTVGYDYVYVDILDPKNKKVDVSGVNLVEVTDALGVYNLIWPAYPIFDTKGTYTLRLVLMTSDARKDITRTAEIKVRDFGRMR